MGEPLNMCIVVGAILLVAIFIFVVSSSPKETYANIGDINNIGSIDDGYELVAAVNAVTRYNATFLPTGSAAWS